MRFCLDDGATLVNQLDATSARSGADATLHLPASFEPQPPTVRITEPPAVPRPTMAFPQTPAAPAMAGSTYKVERKGGAFLWLLGALILGIAAVAVAFIVTRNRGPETSAGNQVATASPAPTTSEPAVPSAPSTAANTAAPPQTRVSTPSPASDKEVLTKGEDPVRKEVSTRQPETVPATKDAPVEKSAPSTVSGGVLNGKATYLAKPAYPPAARAVKASGAVTVQVTLDEQGNVISASAISGNPLLRAAAVSAARASKFSPTKLSGQPVKVTGVITYNFIAD